MTNRYPCHQFTCFFAPIATDHPAAFVKALKEDGRYLEEKKDAPPCYLLPYITEIYKDSSLYSSFSLKKEHFPLLSVYDQTLCLNSPPLLSGIRISCFSTGCAFAEFTVEYTDLPLDQIANFVYYFKNAVRKDKNRPDALSLHDALEQILPHTVAYTSFFSANGFKKECKTFHGLCAPSAPKEEELQGYLTYLRRGYGTFFALPQGDSDYDMLYEPYSYDRFGGSQEALVNLCYYSDDPSANGYIAKYKRAQLENDYRFMYLLLLNQRFSAVRYIDRIAALNKSRLSDREKEKHLNELDLQIIRLKTVFSFNVVSDDLLYQNVYKRMYAILDIDRLLEDICDNEEQLTKLQNGKALETERKTERFLLLLSVLSISSVLIDTSGFLDRLAFGSLSSTLTSVALVLPVVAFYLIVLWRNRRK